MAGEFSTGEATFGSGSYGAGNLGKTGYSWGGPTNVGFTSYINGDPLGNINGNAGIRPYNPAISGSMPTPYVAPVYGNTMGGGAANPYTASSAGVGPYGNTMLQPSGSSSGSISANDLASFYAQNMMGQGSGGAGTSGAWGWGDINPEAGASQYGAGLSSPAMANSNYGTRNIAPNPGAGSSAWDPQNNAWNTLYGQGGKPANLTGTELGANNLWAYADAVNNSNRLANKNAGQAMAAVASPEGAGGNPFALNYSDSGATGLPQWTNTGNRLNNVIQGMGGMFNYSPAAQATAALNEITGSKQYAPTYNALNNPASTGQQMYNQVIGNFEGLSGSPSQMAKDIAGAAQAYGTTLNSRPNYNALGRGN